MIVSKLKKHERVHSTSFVSTLLLRTPTRKSIYNGRNTTDATGIWCSSIAYHPLVQRPSCRTRPRQMSVIVAQHHAEDGEGLSSVDHHRARTERPLERWCFCHCPVPGVECRTFAKVCRPRSNSCILMLDGVDQSRSFASFNKASSSPDSCICIMMSDPPTNSPLTNT